MGTPQPSHLKLFLTHRFGNPSKQGVYRCSCGLRVKPGRRIRSYYRRYRSDWCRVFGPISAPWPLDEADTQIRRGLGLSMGIRGRAHKWLISLLSRHSDVAYLEPLPPRVEISLDDLRLTWRQREIALQENLRAWRVQYEEQLKQHGLVPQDMTRWFEGSPP